MNSESDYLMKLIKKINKKNTEVINEKKNELKNEKNTEEINGNKSNDIEFFYRGHTKQSYKLQPLLYRTLNQKETSEKDIFSYIMTKHSNEFIGMKPLEVLAKMQHLGVATRLLDVTKNPLVGLFFSVDGLKPSEKESIADTAIKESSNNNENNNLENAELIIFNCPSRDIKSYYSDTIKLLSCLPFLEEERKKQLLFDAVNEYLIDVSLTSIFNKLLAGVFFQEDLKSIISFVKEYYYLDEKYKTKNGIEYVLNRIGKFTKASNFDQYVGKNNVENCVNSFWYQIVNKKPKSPLIQFDISKIELVINYYVREENLEKEKFLLEIHISFDRVGNQSGCLYGIMSHKLFDYSGRVQSEIDHYTSDNLYNLLEGVDDYKIESLFSTFSEDGGYRSQAMEELHYKVKDYCPDFRYCAKPLDIINGVYAYPLVNTDRMRAQQGLFAIYGLSQYWNFRKYFEYQRSQKVRFSKALKQFLNNNVKKKAQS